MRKPRSEIVTPGQPVHLMQRGNNRRRLFSYPTEYDYFLRCVFWSCRRFRVAIHAICLMPNHVHALATPPSVEALSRATHSYGQAYATFRNGRRGGSGKLFEERYKSPPIKSEEQLIATTLYIERNPVAAGICDHPEDYRWSTYRLHAQRPGSKVPSNLWSPSAWYLGLGATAVERARGFIAAYARYDEAKLSASQRRCIERVEQASEPYTRRLERPNRTRAGETGPIWPGPCAGK